jgi:hypothetical protein
LGVVVGECFKLYRRRIVRRRGRNQYGSLLNGLSVLTAFFIAGCSLAPFIASNSIDYNTTVESVTNSVLVTNILRARDGAPLYFSDLSQIRGSLQLNVQPVQATLPFGKIYNSVAPGAAQAGPLTVNSQPGFDFAPLNTKKFAEGMLSGIDTKVFAYFIQRGIDPTVFLNLVTIRVDIYRNVDGKFQFDRQCTPYDKHKCLQNLIQSWVSLSNPKMGTLSEPDTIGPPIPTDLFVKGSNALGSLIQADAADLDFKETKKGFQLTKTTVTSVLCVPSHGSYEAIGIASPGAKKDPEEPPLPKLNGTCSKRPPGLYRYVLYVRSVEAIFYYLGALIKYPEFSPFPFFIFDHPVEGTRFRTDYRGQSYFVREASTENGNNTDATITILAILNDLLNLNRKADEIPSTKTVATSP